MPLLSIFTPTGMLEMSSRPSHAEEFYNELLALYGGSGTSSGQPPLDFTPGTYDEAKLYAWAMGLGRCLYELEHAGNQAFPFRAYDLLPLLELDFGLTPGPNDTVPMRQAVLAAAEVLALGAAPARVVAGLRLILKSNFLSLVTATPMPGGGSPAVGFAPTIAPTPDALVPSFAHFADVRIPAKIVQLVDPVVVVGGAFSWVAYQDYGASTNALSLAPNDVIIVQGEVQSAAEATRVVATASSPPAGSFTTPGYKYFQASFTTPHEVGASVTTGNFPYWASTQRFSWIVVTAAAAVDPETRRKIHIFMARIARACSQWAIVAPDTITVTGGTFTGLTVGAAMGTKPIGAFSFQNSN